MEDIVSILIADDNKGLVEFMKLYIQKDSRYNIIGISEDKETEIKMIDNLKPNILITDIRKKRDWIGLDIIRQYKNKEYQPIFFVVSASIMDYYLEIEELGIKYFLTKPYTEENLMRILNDIYNEIYPKQVVLKENDITEIMNTNKIIEFFRKIKKTNKNLKFLLALFIFFIRIFK